MGTHRPSISSGVGWLHGIIGSATRAGWVKKSKAGSFRGGQVDGRTWVPVTGPVSRGTGGRWSDRAKAAYKSWRDYIIAVKGKIRLRVTLSTQSESAAFRRISLISSSGDL